LVLAITVVFSERFFAENSTAPQRFSKAISAFTLSRDILLPVDFISALSASGRASKSGILAIISLII